LHGNWAPHLPWQSRLPGDLRVDACAALTEARHESALSLFAGYCRTLPTDDVIAELRQDARGRTVGQ
jgi:hypothetical protein